MFVGGILKNFFEPKKIAVIGASRSRNKVGGVVFRNLHDAGFDVVPINPNARRVYGKRTYPSVMSYKKNIDLAVVAIPAQFVPWVTKDCAMKGIKNVIIISSGFSESGESGVELERKILKIAEINKMKIMGPNCLGVINVNKNFNASFFKGMPNKGNIAFVSQSGALAVALLDFAIRERISLSKFVSMGNMAQIGFSEVIEYLNNDKETKCICLYIESVKDGKRFMEFAEKCKKPLIAIKAGRSERGIKAASSHTGALAGSAEVYSGAFKQSGVIEVDSISSLFNVAQVIVSGRPKGKRVCILTNAGGPGVLATDACEDFGLSVPELPERIRKKLDGVLPAAWSHDNPIDVIGDATSKRYRAALKILSKSSFYDILLVILTPQAMTDVENITKSILSFKRRTRKPVFACFMGGNRIKNAAKLMKSKGMVNFDEPKRAAKYISLAVKE